MNTQTLNAGQCRDALLILGHWGVTLDEQRNLLGLRDNTDKHQLHQYLGGEKVPEDPEVAERFQLILKIHNALETTFAHSQGLTKYWATTPNSNFGNRKPLEIMLDGGLSSMRNVLDRLYQPGLL